MLTQELFEGLPVAGPETGETTNVKDICIDTRTLEEGDLFVALTGQDDDGHNYLTEADGTAAAVLVESNRIDSLPSLSIPVFTTENTRDLLPDLLKSLYGDPSSSLALIGVTGTNGKTTTTHLIKSILKAEGESTGLIGTIERRFKGETSKGDTTTPSIVETYRLLQDWSERGATAVVMEVSSHALDQGRVKGLSFAAAAFTNLSQDHLDYHDSMEAYYEAKKSLFDQSKKGVVYTDGEYGQRLAEEIEAVSVGESGDYTVKDPSVTLDGIDVTMSTPDDETVQLHSPLTGLFNYRNITLASALAYELGVSVDALREGVEECAKVPGRCERLPGPPKVLVDYAHTPDALENVITSIQPLVQGRTLCVFGAGGDRDRGKRPKMGRIGTTEADYAVITSDNPRSEDPQQIIDDILEGVNGSSSYHVEPDRGQAIRDAIEKAEDEDLVLIVGKGHETEQV
ncbi:MAG: UDP-N-acetylmuramoyl-L-alanyl-D-glutamate--2,6-diaminopimelate ligase, partial [bacterium]